MDPTRLTRYAAVPLAALALAACASGGGIARKDTPKMDYTHYAGQPVDSIRSLGRVNGWTTVSRNQLVIWTGVNEAWLLRVWEPCRELEFANAVSITQSGSSITKFDSVQVGRERCRIEEIRPVDIKQMNADRKAAKGKP